MGIVSLSEKRCSIARMTNAASLSHSVDVFLDPTMIHAKLVIVDDVRGIADLNSLDSNTRDAEERSLASAKTSFASGDALIESFPSPCEQYKANLNRI